VRSNPATSVFHLYAQRPQAATEAPLSTSSVRSTERWQRASDSQ
jgi:hypothetical protein